METKAPDLNQLFQSFNGMNILVVGDVMIDAYFWGEVNRISPEAPVPIVSVNKKERRLGGAANVALNVMTLGANPIICSVVGNDIHQNNFNELLDKRGFTSEGIVKSLDRSTTVKTRIISGGHHHLRVDEEDTHPLNTTDENSLLKRINSLFNSKKIDGVIIEDYNKGVLTERVIQEVISIAQSKGIKVTADPKLENFSTFKNIDLFKPNLKELQEGMGLWFDKSNRKDLLNAIDKMEKTIGNKISFVTLSELGVVIKEGNDTQFIEAHPREIMDVSGAGDTVISVASLALSAGADIRTIAQLANLAGGLVCERVGVVPIDKDTLFKEAQKLF